MTLQTLCVTIRFSLASTLICVLIQNGPMTLNLAHRKTLTFNTQTPSSPCNRRSRETFAALSLQSMYSSSWMLCFGGSVSCIHAQNSGYSTTFKWAISLDLSANNSNHTNPHVSANNVQ